jgi:hypothetical protein
MQTEKSADDAVMDEMFSTTRDRGPAKEPAPAAPEQQVDLEEAIAAVDQQRMVPLSELTSERKKLKAKLEEESRQRIEWETRAKLYQEQAERAGQPQRPQPQRQVPIPDVFNDPEGYARYVEAQAAHRLETERLHNSEERARDKFGDAVVEEALDAARKAGLIERGHFLQANPRHPWGELVAWHKQQKVLATVGDDPDAYRKKVEDEIRAKLASEGSAGGTTAPGAPPQRFPGTLADNTAAGPQGAHLTEGAAMGSLFDTNRKRKS